MTRGIVTVLCAALTLASTPAAAGYSPDWNYTLERGREAALRSRAAAEKAARAAAERSAYELRTRRLPNQTAPALASAIRYSRDEARGAGVRRPPAHVLKKLAPYFPAATLERVRWRSTPHREPTLGYLLVGWYMREGAVTLDDTIVFSDSRLADDVWFWAHELTHVEQYRRYGVDGFARRYVNDWKSLEKEATQNANRIAAGLRRSRR